MSDKMSAFARFHLLSKQRRLKGKRKRGSQVQSDSSDQSPNKLLKRVEKRSATPHKLLELTRSPKVYVPSSGSTGNGISSSSNASSSPNSSSISSCILPSDISTINGETDRESPKQKSSKKSRSKRRRTAMENNNNNNGKVNPITIETIVTSPTYMFDSRLEGEKCFEWLIQPTTTEVFFRDIWEKRPLVIKRQDRDYYKSLFSMAHLDHILKTKNVWFGKNIDITSYENGKRETYNPPGRAFSNTVWNYYQSGCSVRMLNPQTFSSHVWKLNSTLQEYFNNFVGTNMYLTPAGFQGFAPHYDDIEAFILQIEGSKNWRVYPPKNQQQTLPRYSSPNFKQEEIGKPIVEILLEAGDLLYFPRGFIHQAAAPSNTHSLHLTVSTCQKNSWGDFLELMIPAALQMAINEDIEFRQSIPRNLFSNLGVANSDLETEDRAKYIGMIEKLMHKIIHMLPIDGAADQMAKKNMLDFLPPLLTKNDEKRSIHGNFAEWRKGVIIGDFELEPSSKIKLLRAEIIRLVLEEEMVRVYYYLDNSREYHKEQEQFIEIAPNLAPGVECLYQSYPNWVQINDLPLESLNDKIDIANLLYEKGLIMADR